MPTLKVLVADDSAIMQKIFTTMLGSDKRLEIVGTASNGFECVQKAEQLKPAVILLDLDMPQLSGPDTIKELSQRNIEVAVLVLCDFNQKDSTQLKAALDAGAFDYFVKPKSTLEIDRYQKQVVTKIFVASFSKTKQIPRATEGVRQVVAQADRGRVRRVTVIGCSTGGKQSLQQLLPQLTPETTTSLVVIIHQPAFIVQQLIKEMNTTCKVAVSLAEDNGLLGPGRVLMAPTGNKNVVLQRGGDEVRLRFAEMGGGDSGTMPIINRLFESAAAVMGEDCMAILLSGSGTDGIDGMKAVRNVKGHTVAEDRSTATVSQLPVAAVNAQVVDEILAIGEMARRLSKPASSRG